MHDSHLFGSSIACFMVASTSGGNVPRRATSTVSLSARENDSDLPTFLEDAPLSPLTVIVSPVRAPKFILSCWPDLTCLSSLPKSTDREEVRGAGDTGWNSVAVTFYTQF